MAQEKPSTKPSAPAPLSYGPDRATISIALMRAAALIVILAIFTTLAAGAQCITACAQPAPPPCHHAPQKAVKTCDTPIVFEDRAPVTIVAALSFVLPAPEPAAPEFSLARIPFLHPPGTTAPLILRI
ncbi:MAG: hypothetical protein JWP63_2531 [Candidatus Solibacter sp.]|nr:hypothetical protein [Candidatus Solibacter sp.]